MARTKEEYEIQHYGFALEELKFDTKEMFMHEITEALRKICLSIEKNATSPATKEILRNKKEHILEKMGKIIDKAMQKYNETIDKHLAIPPYVLLPENRIHDIRNPQYTQEDEVVLREEFEQKKRQFEENIAMIREITKITEAFAQLEPALEVETALHGEIEKALEECGDTSSLKKNLGNISEIVDRFHKK